MPFRGFKGSFYVFRISEAAFDDILEGVNFVIEHLDKFGFGSAEQSDRISFWVESIDDVEAWEAGRSKDKDKFVGLFHVSLNMDIIYMAGFWEELN